MPQLSTTFIFLFYLWTWFMLHLTMQKTKMVLINSTPMKTPQHKTMKASPTLQWT